MPKSTLSSDRILALLPHRLSESALDDLLFVSKAEVDGRSGDALTVSVTPDRLDLLSEGGLALHLQGAMEVALGLPPVASRPGGPTVEIRVDRSVVRRRPVIAGAVVRPPEGGRLDEGLLAEAVRFQELLHATIGRDRRAASLGIYPLDRVTPPISYSLEPLTAIRFVPLDGAEEVSGGRFFDDHPMAARFGPLGREGEAALVLRDSADGVLSLPPILNSRSHGEARVGDGALLLESTGTVERNVRESLGLLLVPFAARGWAVHPVPVVGPEGMRSDGRGFVEAHSVELPSSLLRAIAGSALASAEVERRLARARLRAHPHAGGWKVDAPPWRPDLAAPVDVVEDVLLTVAIRPEDGTIPPSTTRGRRRSENRFRRAVGLALLGLGFAAPHTPVLVSDAAVARLPGATPIRVANPVSAEFAYVRDRLLLSHLDVLARNTRHSYPQRFAEVAPVVVRNPSAEAGAETRYRAGLVVASDTAGFADAAALVEYLLRRWDVGFVRESADVPGTIPGRAARVRVAGEPVAELGEVPPGLLEELRVPVPAVWGEVDLTALWPLLGAADGA